MSSASELIRRFRENKPTPRSERGDVGELWWVDRSQNPQSSFYSNTSAPSSSSHREVRGGIGSGRLEETEPRVPPIPFHQSKQINRDSPRGSIDYRDRTSRDAKNISYDDDEILSNIRSNSSKPHLRRIFGTQENNRKYQDDSEDEVRHATNNNNRYSLESIEQQSTYRYQGGARDSMRGSDDNNFKYKNPGLNSSLRNSVDTLGSTGYKALLMGNLKLDYASLMDDILDDKKENNPDNNNGPVGEMKDLTTDLDTLLSSLHQNKDKNEPEPEVTETNDYGVVDTISEVTHRLDSEMSAFKVLYDEKYSQEDSLAEINIGLKQKATKKESEPLLSLVSEYINRHPSQYMDPSEFPLFSSLHNKGEKSRSIINNNTTNDYNKCKVENPFVEKNDEYSSSNYQSTPLSHKYDNQSYIDISHDKILNSTMKIGVTIDEVIASLNNLTSNYKLTLPPQTQTSPRPVVLPRDESLFPQASITISESSKIQIDKSADTFENIEQDYKVESIIKPVHSLDITTAAKQANALVNSIIDSAVIAVSPPRIIKENKMKSSIEKELIIPQQKYPSPLSGQYVMDESKYPSELNVISEEPISNNNEIENILPSASTTFNPNASVHEKEEYLKKMKALREKIEY
jgi:hypothetical protein